MPRVLRTVLLMAFAACNNGAGLFASLAGTYTATEFRVEPTGQETIDVLAEGGSLAIRIASDNFTTGTLILPASVTGAGTFAESMTGQATQSGSTVRFQQTADTFVRDLTWTRDGTSLTVRNQIAGDAAFTITLTRQ
jgi:hypothetical protein